MKLKAICIAIICVGLMGFSIPSKLDKKVNKALVKYFETEVITKELITLSPEIIEGLSADFNERFFKVEVNGNHEGYAYVGNAPSKTATFDYLLVFDVDFIIMHSKVLIYREEYGGEIGSKRWLRQFKNKHSFQEEKLEYGNNISAISGATISVRSMTNAVNDVLGSLKTLLENGDI